MSEVRDPEKKPEHEKKNDRDFISEKIVRPAPSKKQVGTRMATAACAGIIFGVVSAVCFVLTRPIMEQLSDGNKPTASVVSIPKDELESSAEAQETVRLRQKLSRWRRWSRVHWSITAIR